MIPEIMGKLSGDGSNLTDRSEDKLTGNVFGALRYISFNELMKIILERIVILGNKKKELQDIIGQLDYKYWDKNIEFWPHDREAELDIVIDFDEIIIGIEVKYLSGLSSEDQDEYLESVEESKNQLARESRVLRRRKSGSNKEALLLFLAPENICYSICNDSRKKIAEGVSLAYISWEEILETLMEIHLASRYEQLVVNDIIKLLKRKGFERFKDFKLETEDIDEDCYFEFIYEEIMEVDIDFKYFEKVEGDGFYEFG